MQSSADNSVSAISWHYTRVVWCGSPCQLAENERELWTVNRCCGVGHATAATITITIITITYTTTTTLLSGPQSGPHCVLLLLLLLLLRFVVAAAVCFCCYCLLLLLVVVAHCFCFCYYCRRVRSQVKHLKCAARGLRSRHRRRSWRCVALVTWRRKRENK